MKVIDSGTVFSSEGHERQYWVKEDEEGDDPVLFCVASSESLHVYTMYELTSRDYDQMEFITEEYCAFCDSDKSNCATRLSHDLDEIDLPLPEFNGEPPTALPEYICEDCVENIASESDVWLENNREEIASLVL